MERQVKVNSWWGTLQAVKEPYVRPQSHNGYRKWPNAPLVVHRKGCCNVLPTDHIFREWRRGGVSPGKRKEEKVRPWEEIETIWYCTVYVWMINEEDCWGSSWWPVYHDYTFKITGFRRGFQRQSKLTKYEQILMSGLGANFNSLTQ